MFLSLRFMSLCKSVCFIRGRGQRPPRVCVASYGQCDATCVCVSACFRGLNPMTVPQMSLSKFRASLGYRGLVLGLNVSNFFRAFGYFQWSTCKLHQRRTWKLPTYLRHKKLRAAVLARLGHPFLCQHFLFFRCSR